MFQFKSILKLKLLTRTKTLFTTAHFFYLFSGKLHHHIVALQVSEGTAVRKLEAATQKLSKQEAHLLRLERKIDEKDQALYHAKMEARNKAKFLKRTIQDLRRQYSGALPLIKQVHVLSSQVN